MCCCLVVCLKDISFQLLRSERILKATMQIVEPIPTPAPSPPRAKASNAFGKQKELIGEFRCSVTAMGAQLASQNYALADNFLDEVSSYAYCFSSTLPCGVSAFLSSLSLCDPSAPPPLSVRTQRRPSAMKC